MLGGGSQGVVPKCRLHCVGGGVLAPQPAVPSPSSCGALCRSLEAISGLESRGRLFTVQVQGLLHLQVRLRGWTGWEEPRPRASTWHCPASARRPLGRVLRGGA